MGRRTPDAVLEKVENIVRTALDERFGDEFVFDPIIVKRRYYYDDEEYLHVYVVCDGDFDKLPASWTGRLPGIIVDNTSEEELPGIPSKTFIGKAEWLEVYEGRVW